MLINSLFLVLKYATKGVLFTFYLIFKVILKVLFYDTIGLTWVSYFVYRFIKLVIYGIAFPFVLIYDLIALVVNYFRILNQKVKDDARRKREIKLREKKQRDEKRKLQEEAEKKRKQEVIDAKKYKNISFVKHVKNKNDMKYQALLINFEGEDAVKSDVNFIRIRWKKP